MKLKAYYFIFFICCLIVTTSCGGESYSDKLDKEKKAITAFLSTKVVERNLPADNNFITVEDTDENTAPYYALADGVYMQVVSKGTPAVGMAVKADTETNTQGTLVYYLYKGTDLLTNELKANTIQDGIVSEFRFGASSYPTMGLAIEQPMNYIYRDGIVNLIIPSKAGPTALISNVVPYLFYIEYNKAGNS